jgi:hypothetical protein
MRRVRSFSSATASARGRSTTKPMAAVFMSPFWSYVVSASRSSRKYSSVPFSVISYSVRGGPPAVDGAISCAYSSPCFAICFRAWLIEPGLALDHSCAPQYSRSLRTW